MTKKSKVAFQSRFYHIEMALKNNPGWLLGAILIMILLGISIAAYTQ